MFLAINNNIKEKIKIPNKKKVASSSVREAIKSRPFIAPNMSKYKMFQSESYFQIGIYSRFEVKISY